VNPTIVGITDIDGIRKPFKFPAVLPDHSLPRLTHYVCKEKSSKNRGKRLQSDEEEIEDLLAQILPSGN
jgi:hypothetical protein